MFNNKRHFATKHLVILLALTLSGNLVGFAPMESEAVSGAEVIAEENSENQDVFENGEITGGNTEGEDLSEKKDESDSSEFSEEVGEFSEKTSDLEAQSESPETPDTEQEDGEEYVSDGNSEGDSVTDIEPEDEDPEDGLDEVLEFESKILGAAQVKTEYNNLDELLKADIPAGTTVKTKGYASAGDGGAASYVICDTPTVRKYFAPKMKNGKYAQMVVSATINVAQVGIFPNQGISDQLNTLIWEAFKNDTVNTIQFNDGTYLLDSMVALRSLNYKGTGKTVLSVSKQFKKETSLIMAAFKDEHCQSYSLTFSKIDFLMETTADHLLKDREVTLLSLAEIDSCKITDCNFKSCLAKENGAFMKTDLLWFRHSTKHSNIEVSNCTFRNLTGMNYPGDPKDTLVGGCIWLTGKGDLLDSKIENVKIHDCLLESTVTDEILGIWRGQFKDVQVYNCTFKNHSHDSHNFLSFYLGTFKNCGLKNCDFDIGAGCRHCCKVNGISGASDVTFDGLNFNLHSNINEPVNRNICLFVTLENENVKGRHPATVNIKNTTVTSTKDTVFRTFAHTNDTSFKTYDIYNCNIDMPCKNGVISTEKGDRNTMKLRSCTVDTHSKLAFMKNDKLCKFVVDGNTIKNKPDTEFANSAACFFGFSNNTCEYGENSRIIAANALHDTDYIYYYSAGNKYAKGVTMQDFYSNNKTKEADVLIRTNNPDGIEIDQKIKEAYPEEVAPVAEQNKQETAQVQSERLMPFTVTVDDITYTIGSDGNATVDSIGQIKKASINEVIIDGVTYPVTRIAAKACKGNKKIKSVTIGKNVTSIGKYAFKGCKKLKKVTIKANKSLKVRKGAFKGLPDNAKIKVKGLKGKAKTKMISAVQKRTNAVVE